MHTLHAICFPLLPPANYSLESKGSRVWCKYRLLVDSLSIDMALNQPPCGALRILGSLPPLLTVLVIVVQFAGLIDVGTYPEPH